MSNLIQYDPPPLNILFRYNGKEPYIVTKFSYLGLLFSEGQITQFFDTVSIGSFWQNYQAIFYTAVRYEVSEIMKAST